MKIAKIMEEVLVISDWIRDKVLGSGSFGIVSLWRNIKTNEEFAIKMCKWDDSGELTPKHKERWSKEVEMMNQIRHDNIIATRQLPEVLKEGLKVSNISKLPILCMEYCKLGDLRQVLNKSEYSNGLPEQQVRCILNDMKNAISYLHSLKITHRDLKPENILLHYDKNNEYNITYKLIDLGYAKEIDSNSVCASFVGTLQYLAPELLYSKTYSNTVDYWSFGLVAYEVITGIRPFLPNLPPVHWMQLVKKKTFEQISVFENLKGEVEYSENMFNENYISSCFQGFIEKWLRMALNWDPKKRGRNMDDKSVKFLLPTEGQNGETLHENFKEESLVIFSLLDDILTKKILIIFSTITYEYLSYEIDDFTLFGTVQLWVERDTKIPKEKHLFLSKSNVAVNQEELACQYWQENSDLMLYFFETDTLINENIAPNLSSKLKYCLDNKNLKLSYSLLIGVFTNSLHYIKVQKNLYETLIKAFGLRISHLKNNVNQLHTMHNETDKIFAKLIEKSEIIANILEMNNKFCANNHLPQEYKVLLDKCKKLNENASKCIEAWNKLTTRLQSAFRNCTEINEEVIIQKLGTNSFTELETYAQNYITQVNRIPRDERGVARPCLDAVRIVYKCLKIRDILLESIKKQQIMHKILSISLQVKLMQTAIKSANENALVTSQSLYDVILEKEQLTLKLLNQSLFSNFEEDNLPTVLPTQNGEEIKRPRINFQYGGPVTNINYPCDLTVDKNDLSSLLNESYSIQKEAEKYNDRFIEICKSMHETMDIDFTYMDEPF